MKYFQKFENLVTDASWTILKTGGAYLLGIFENFYGFFFYQNPYVGCFPSKIFFRSKTGIDWTFLGVITKMTVIWPKWPLWTKMTVIDQNDRYSMRQWINGHFGKSKMTVFQKTKNNGHFGAKLTVILNTGHFGIL